jgi:hypothetical protein
MITGALLDLGIPLVSCNELWGMTLGQALARGKLPRGGYALASLDCLQDPPGWTTYNDFIDCAGFYDQASDQKFRDEASKCVGELRERARAR